MRILLQILSKEIREARRDRSLVVNLVLVPLFLYPILGFGAWQVLLVVRGAQEGRVERVWLDADLPAALADSLQQIEGLEFAPTPAALDRVDAPPTGDEVRNAREGAQAPQAVVAAWRAPGAAVDSVAVFHDASRERSQAARERLLPVLRAHRRALLEARGHAQGLQAGDLVPWTLAAQDVAGKRQWGRYLLSLLLPVLLVVLLPQGAYYAALDTVVGERERGTLETLLTAPVGRGAILAGKFLYVTLSSVLTFLLNLVGLGLFAAFAAHLAGLGEAVDLRLGVGECLAVLVAALLASALLAAAMMVAAAPSRNYREGQAALMPLYLLPALGGVVVVALSAEAARHLAWVPLINVAVLLRLVLAGEAGPSDLAVVLGSLALPAVGAVVLAARVARHEELLFDPEPSLRRLLFGPRRTR